MICLHETKKESPAINTAGGVLLGTELIDPFAWSCGVILKFAGQKVQQ